MSSCHSQDENPQPFGLKSSTLTTMLPMPQNRVLYGDVTIAVEGLQNLGLCLALWAFEQGGIFIVLHLLHLLWHGALDFLVSLKRLPHLVASYNTQGDAQDLFLPISSLAHIANF
jgi:hypothetical protein